MNARVRPAFTAEELTNLFEQVPAIVWACDRDLRFTFSAGSALGKLGLKPHEVVGKPIEEYFGTAPEGGRLVEHVRGALAAENFTDEVQWKDVIFESHIAPLRDSGGAVIGVVGVALDVTERRAIEDELVISRLGLEHTTALFPVAHYVIDQSEMVELTAEHRAILGLASDAAAIAYAGLLALIHPDDRKPVIEARRLGLANREPYRVQFRILRPDGSIRHVRLHASFVFDKNGEAVRTVGTLTDITEELERQGQITELLQRDGITGLPNRVYFGERLRHELAFAGGSNELMALVLFDLDRFSRINDSLGHLAGDEYLRIVASRIRSSQESSQDLAARIGGDEFAVLLRGAQRRGDLVRRIETLRALLEEPVTIGERPLHVSVSMGVALYPYDAPDQTLLQKADLALSRARSDGMGRTEYYDLLLAQDVASSVRLEHGLHTAIRNSQIVPYYQPIVDCGQRVQAVEALVRWNHPEYGLLSPATFLDVAEESGLIVDLGEKMLRQACVDAVSFRSRLAALRLNVNLSSRHLLSRRLVEVLTAALTKSSLPPAALQFEVTEQSLIADVSAGRKAIDSLRALGSTVVIDDFGTGYNTLGYVKSFHVDGLKLDRTFVRDMVTDRYSRAICEGVMAMARSLELPVIAEGIENAQQRDAAIALGCTELQGFLFGKPASAKTIQTLFT